jgi:hypothetical protein
MNILFSEVYWGALIILAGVLLIIKNVFHVEIPVMGIIFPIVIITLGISLLTGFKGKSTDSQRAIFSESTVTADSANAEYSVVFGKGVYDLRNIKLADKIVKVEINSVFSSAIVKVDPATPMRIKVESAFAGGTVVQGKVAAFGDNIYRSASFKEDAPFVDVEAHVVFGNLQVKEEPLTTY